MQMQSSKLYTNITFTFDINLSLVYTADLKKYWSSSSYTQMTNNVSYIGYNSENERT